MKTSLIILISVISGIIFNIILGFIPYPSGGLIGSQKWGYPIYWLSQVIYPGAPIEISWLNFTFDCIIWIISFFSTIKLIIFLKNKSKK